LSCFLIEATIWLSVNLVLFIIDNFKIKDYSLISNCRRLGTLTVPFEYQSGISIKGKHRVHKMANKNLKSLLHLCAISAIKYVQEIKDYFNRKVEEGKHKMSIINAIRNKLVLRAFAVVRNDKPFVENTCFTGE
ncbi:MAG: transposase, partial [Ferruginibacter sp.]